MEPRPPVGSGAWASIVRTTARLTSAWLRRLSSIVRSQPSAVSSWIGPSPKRRPLPPATDSRPSMRPAAARQAAMAPSTAVSSVRSAACASAVPPAARMRAASASALAAVRDTTKIRAPSAASCAAPAAAIPVEPVTRQTRSARRPVIGRGRDGRDEPAALLRVSRGRSPNRPHRDRTGVQERGGVRGVDPAGHDRLDLGQRALHLPDVRRPKGGTGEQLHEGRAGAPRPVRFGRRVGAGHEREPGGDRRVEDRQVEDGRDGEDAPGIPGGAELVEGRGRSRRPRRTDPDRRAAGPAGRP